MEFRRILCCGKLNPNNIQPSSVKNVPMRVSFISYSSKLRIIRDNVFCKFLPLKGSETK